MRRVVGGFAISIDGYFESDDSDTSWMIMDKEFDYSSHMKRFDTFLFGSKSYDRVKDVQYSFEGIRSFVFSNSLQQVANGYTLVRDDPKNFLHELIRNPGKDIAVYGGAKLLTSLIESSCIDELILSVMPVILGKGVPFIGKLTDRKNLSLTNSVHFPSGVVMLTYNLSSNKLSS